MHVIPPNKSACAQLSLLYIKINIRPCVDSSSLGMRQHANGGRGTSYRWPGTPPTKTWMSPRKIGLKNQKKMGKQKSFTHALPVLDCNKKEINWRWLKQPTSLVFTCLPANKRKVEPTEEGGEPDMTNDGNDLGCKKNSGMPSKCGSPCGPSSWKPQKWS